MEEQSQDGRGGGDHPGHLPPHRSSAPPGCQPVLCLKPDKSRPTTHLREEHTSKLE